MTIISPQTWHCVAREEDFVHPGDWVLAPLTPAGVVVVRQQEGSLKAFHAVCTHRGAAFLDAECGRAARFTCPYHGFQFELSGRACQAVPDLKEVRVAEHLGFVFVTLDPHAGELEEEWPPWLARADLGALKRAHRIAYDVKARPEIVLENFQESLHFPTVHPALEALTPSALAETWPPYGPWLGGIMPIVGSAETVSLSGQRSGRSWVAAEDDRRLVHDAVRVPNLLTSLQPDYLLTFFLFAIDGITRVFASIYVHEDAPDDASDVIDFWARVHEEDRVACERQERGLRSLEMRAKYTDVEEGAAAIAAMIAQKAPPLRKPHKHAGIFGRPYADLRGLVDTSGFPELHDEITRGLAQVETRYTGGTLKWMGVTAPWTERDGYRDAMHAVQAMSRAERAELVALGEYDEEPPEDAPLGDETPYPFSRAQERFLEQRHGAYFPWKASYHLLENDRWDDKHSGDGKDFSEEAREVFPKTIAFIESLPFTEIGRVVIFGLLPNDHAPAHRDSEPGKALAIAQSISFAPGGKKRFFLTTPDGREEVVVDTPIYWFNDMDWHGVHADPFFRYSVRVDGVFDPAFLDAIRGSTRAR